MGTSIAFGGGGGTDFFAGGALLAPFEVPVSDYAVEAVVQMPRGSPNGPNEFGLFARATSNMRDQAGYLAGSLYGRVGIGIASELSWAGNNLAEVPLSIDSGLHIWRFEVRQNRLRLLIDGALVAEAVDNRYLRGSRAGVFAAYAQPVVCWFGVRSLD